ncbi:alpha-E domain-containing protein [Salimicrobium sp. PL1-032A]|uniref:alpha-E domain-containing protein n=1 Tax=Salimicrobium sp. PL1-032A TaxID=3095364 RepID=UPI003260BDF4
MLSRTADALYWMGRNIERAENNARVLNVQLIHMLEASDRTALDRDWKEVLEICASYADYMEKYNRLETQTIVEYLTTSPVNPNTMKNCMAIARDNARTTRDILPAELWEVLNEFHLDQTGLREDGGALSGTKGYLKTLMRTSMTAQGVIESSMSRGTPYTFIKIGKWLERAEKTARVLNVICEKELRDKGTSGNSYYYWLAALRFLNGYDAFIKENPPTMASGEVLDFLIKQEAFPRSIAYGVSHVREAIIELEGGEVRHYSARLFDLLETVETDIHGTAVADMEMEELMEFLDHFQKQCMHLSQVFMETYYLTPPAAVR